MNDDHSIVVVTIFCVGLVATFCVWVAGRMQKVVLFYDWNDVFLTCGAVISSLATYFCYSVEPPADGFAGKAMYFTFFGVTILLAAYFLYKVVGSAIAHNRSYLAGIIVGIFKILFVSFIALFIMSKIEEYMKSHRERRLGRWDILIIGLLAGAIAYVVKSAINGESVYRKRESVTGTG